MCQVLIVEDNPIFRAALRNVLTTRFPAMEIEEAADGEEALAKFQELEPVMILMDIKLPGRNGLEITRAIKSTNSSTEIIILTSYDIPEYREAAFRNGASHFLTKGNATGDEIASLIVSGLAGNDGEHRNVASLS